METGGRKMMLCKHGFFTCKCYKYRTKEPNNEIIEEPNRVE